MAVQIPSAGSPGDPDVEFLGAEMDVGGRHGPLHHPPTRRPLEFVNSVSSLYKLSWANSFCIVKFHFRMKLYSFISDEFLMFTCCDPSY